MEVEKRRWGKNQQKHIDIEDYYFYNGDDYKYEKPLATEEVIEKLEKDFDKYNDIIFTACKGEYGNISDTYDFAIYICVDKEIRLERVKNRSYKKFGDRILKNGDLYERENRFFNKVYEKNESEVIKWFRRLKCNKMQIDGLKSTDENVEIILSELTDKYILYNNELKIER